MDCTQLSVLPENPGFIPQESSGLLGKKGKKMQACQPCQLNSLWLTRSQGSAMGIRKTPRSQTPPQAPWALALRREVGAERKYSQVHGTQWGVSVWPNLGCKNCEESYFDVSVLEKKQIFVRDLLVPTYGLFCLKKSHLNDSVGLICVLKKWKWKTWDFMGGVTFLMGKYPKFILLIRKCIKQLVVGWSDNTPARDLSRADQPHRRGIGTKQS